MNAPIGNVPAMTAGREQIATASELVRQFGVWQDRAAVAPVYILHRGRPRFVLTTVDLMETLCAPHEPAGGIGALDVATILERGRDAVLAADADLRVTAISRTAGLLLGDVAARDAPLETIASGEVRSLFLDAIHRVIARARAEEIDLPSPRAPSRRLAVTIEPLGAGVVLFLRDRGIEEEHDAALSERRGYDEALITLDGAARARVNLRGYLTDPSPSLAAWAGVALDTLARVRFVSLFDVADRPVVADAVDAVATTGQAQSVPATLLVNRGDPVTVSIGLAPLRIRLAVAAIAVVIVRRVAG